MKQYLITHKECGQRIDKYVKKLLNDAPLSFIYKLFRKKDVKIDGHWVKQDYILQDGETLTIYVTEEQMESFHTLDLSKGVNMDLDIVYEDENILIINKEKGVLVHDVDNKEKHTLANGVLTYLINKGEYNPRVDIGFTPGPAHRLDRNTSGLVIFGKNLPTLQCLQKEFKNKENIEKTYLALVVGSLKDNQGSIDYPLLKDEKKGIVEVNDKGKTALTLYSVNRRYKGYTLVNVTLVTGRTHQIRVHFKTIGNPVVGDGKYGDFAENKEFYKRFKYDSQFLHAYKIKFAAIGKPLDYLNGKEFVGKLGEKEQAILRSLEK